MKLQTQNTVFIIPCSGAKNHDAEKAKGASINKYLPASMANNLTKHRNSNAKQVRLNETTLARAMDRYDGTLYKIARTAIYKLLQDKAHVLILSGGYGIVLATEPIGMYNHIFKASMWRDHIVEQALLAYCEKAKATTVIGIMSASTSYAKLMRKITWPQTISEATLITPQRGTGAMVKAPRAQGEALTEIATKHKLNSNWHSSDGLGISMEHLKGS